MKFNKNKEKLTVGEILKPAMEITKQEVADEYLRDYISYIVKNSDVSIEKATDIAKENLAYWAGYYSDDVRRRVERLFNSKHPIFGSIEENGSPSAIDAFNMGKNMAIQTTREDKINNLLND
jgi:hypothetical protein